MKDIYEKIAELADSGTLFVLCRIINAKGSTPRRTGAVMTVDAAGNTEGSVGGGRPEYECIMKAREMLDMWGKQESADRTVLHFELNPGKPVERDGEKQSGTEARNHDSDASARNTQTSESDYICGGEMDVEIRLVGPDEKTFRNELIEKTRAHKRKKVYIFGGGHVAQALVPVLASIDFEPVVFEERPEFAKKELFLQASDVLCGEFARLSDTIRLEKEDYAAIMTRGHQDDYSVLKQVLSSDAGYIGLMGSRSKRKAIFDRLKEDGFDDDDIGRIHSPIGIDIGSETPEEIAVSIAAELIMLRSVKKQGRT